MLSKKINIIISLTIVSILILASLPVHAGDKAPSWKASWISVTTPPAPNQWICYRKIVRLDKAPRQALARIGADSKYWLWINGKLVVFEGQLKRGPTPQDTYYDQVDLTKHLQKGDNTIAVLLWYFGKHGFSHKSSGQAGLVFDATIDGTRLLSDTSWKAMVHPSFGNTGKPRPNKRLPESNIRFDAAKEPVGWQQPGFDDSSWPEAVSYGMPPCAPWNKLIKRPIPLWKDFGLKSYVNADAKLRRLLRILDILPLQWRYRNVTNGLPTRETLSVDLEAWRRRAGRTT